MVASSPPSRSITVVNSASGAPRAVEAFLGNLLEVVIHSIESLRERLGNWSQR